MSYPIEVAINVAAEIYGRKPFSPNAMQVYRYSVNIKDDSLFVKRLFELLKTCKHFPLPADFNLIEQPPHTA